MSPSLDTSNDTQATPATSLIAVAGNPNCGKTTIFNALTGLRHKVGNYAGVTVEKREGILRKNRNIRLLDLPGTYSLSARSPDEEIVREVLLGHVADTRRPDAVLVVVDAANLERNLYLAVQIIELGLPVVIACNMMDQLERTGQQLDTKTLSIALDVPMIPTVAHEKQGIEQLRSTLISTIAERDAGIGRRRWTLDDASEKGIADIVSAMTETDYVDPAAADGAALILVGEGTMSATPLPHPVVDALEASRKRLNFKHNDGVSLEITRNRYAWIHGIVEGCLSQIRPAGTNLTDRLDRVLTHRFWGMLTFAAVMAALFFSIFSLAEPLIELIEDGIAWMQSWLESVMSAGVLRDLLTDGVLAGVGNVVVFFPQICILFLFLAILEDSGYMARAAFLMNRYMTRFGLCGKSFIPLLSCHACAIPGIMATRTIENPKARLITILVAPLMSCSARLPVYTVLIAACLPGSSWIKASTLASLYVLGIATAMAMATLLRKTLFTEPAPAFILELPPYRTPRMISALRVTWDRSAIFLKRAGTIIAVLTIIFWVLTQFPSNPQRADVYGAQRTTLHNEAPPDLAEQLQALHQAEAADNLVHSYAGQLGHLIEPVIKPLGYDWRIGVGVIASFAAREVFIGTMGVVFSVGEADETSTPLRDQLRTATWPDGSKLFTPIVAVSLLVFYALACQCFGTIAVVRRETNSWRWPVFMVAYMTVLAYVGALVVYQVGSALGIGTV